MERERGRGRVRARERESECEGERESVRAAQTPSLKAGVSIASFMTAACSNAIGSDPRDQGGREREKEIEKEKERDRERSGFCSWSW